MVKAYGVFQHYHLNKNDTQQSISLSHTLYIELTLKHNLYITLSLRTSATILSQITPKLPPVCCTNIAHLVIHLSFHQIN